MWADRKRKAPPTGALFLCYYDEHMKETLILKEQDLSGLAFKVLEILSEDITTKAKVILLEGDLGAGKTTFTKELAEALGIEKEKVNSPTFILKKDYRTNHTLYKKLVHIDAYRFTHPTEAKVLRLQDDLKDGDTIVVVEWPSKMSFIKSDIEIIFKHINEEEREITLSYGKK